MSEHIDHAAEAREWIDAAARHPGATSTAILAQAEATLALVEQQRIANLIALRKAWTPVEQACSDDLARFYNVGNVIDEDIAAALGIGDDDE